MVYFRPLRIVLSVSVLSIFSITLCPINLFFGFKIFGEFSRIHMTSSQTLIRHLEVIFTIVPGNYYPPAQPDKGKRHDGNAVAISRHHTVLPFASQRCRVADSTTMQHWFRSIDTETRPTTGTLAQGDGVKDDEDFQGCGKPMRPVSQSPFMQTGDSVRSTMQAEYIRLPFSPFPAFLTVW